MIAKSQLLTSLQDLPDEFTLDELFERAIFIEKINRALEEVKTGETYTTEEARQKLREWSK